MHFHVTLTNNCKLKCRYCYGKSCEDFCSDLHGLAVDYSLPSSVAYDTEVLLREIMDEVNTSRFMIQTGSRVRQQV